MKEAFWGVLIVVLGLFGIVVVNLFQNITVDNDRIYYVIKEATEGAAFDAIDLANYRLNGTLRIVEDKFVENLTRRFAENISKGNYKIVVEDINEMPPKVSLRVQTGVGMLNTSLLGKEDPFNIVNRVDAIIETKYTKEEIESSGITITEPEDPIIGDICKPTTGDIGDPSTDGADNHCIDGDIMFTGDEEISIAKKICKGTTPPSNINKTVNYKVCECGTWVEKSETLTASPRKVGNEWVYEWVFYKEGKNRVINQVIKEKILELKCTEGIQIMVPDDIDEKNQNNVTIPYQPSADNSRYEVCPAEGIKIPIGMEFVAHPNYIPKDSINRDLEWTVADTNVIGVIGKNPSKTCDLNIQSCFSTAIIKANELGTTYINVKTTQIPGINNPIQNATCKVEVYDGSVSSIGCENLTVEVGETSEIKAVPNPKNATNHNYTYQIGNTSVATINNNKVTGVAGGTTTITITETNTNKTGSCTVKVPMPPLPPDVPYADETGGGTYEGTRLYYIKDEKGNVIASSTSYDNAKKRAEEEAAKNPTSAINLYYYNSNSSTNIWIDQTTCNGTEIVTAVYNGGAVLVKTSYKPNSYSPSSSGGNQNSGSQNSETPVKPGVSKPSQGSGGSCLDENEKVLTENGYKKISEIAIGEKVLSYNTKTGQNEYKEVLMIYKHKNMYDVLYTFVVNNKKIQATRLHEFYVKRNSGYSWIIAEELKIGDLLISSDGNYYPIRKISSKFKLSTYYDLSVKDNHNFFVGKDNILVHNRITKSAR